MNFFPAIRETEREGETVQGVARGLLRSQRMNSRKDTDIYTVDALIIHQVHPPDSVQQALNDTPLEKSRLDQIRLDCRV